MKLVCYVTIEGADTLKVITTANTANQGALLKIKPGVGKPFFMWPTLPDGDNPVMCDFSEAPIVTADAAANNALIAGITATPGGVLTYAE